MMSLKRLPIYAILLLLCAGNVFNVARADESIVGAIENVDDSGLDDDDIDLEDSPIAVPDSNILPPIIAPNISYGGNYYPSIVSQNYSTPGYIPVEIYPQPQQGYVQTPGAYQVPVQPSYQVTVQPGYQTPLQPSYQGVLQQGYQAPVLQAYQSPNAPVYQAQAQVSYQGPVGVSYQAPLQTGYQGITQSNYQNTVETNYPNSIQPVIQSTPVQTPYQILTQPAYQPTVVQSNYQSNIVQTAYPGAVKQAPLYSQLGTALPYAGAQVANYTVGPSFAPGTYPSIVLNQLTNFIGYLPNSKNSYYYRAAPYQTCPKNVYLNGPTPKDIQDAFIQAHQQLVQVRGSTINYINSTQHSFAARHAIFSFLSQSSPRMDEEGLLVEYVSQYLANRACMTKWDKQRYLPSLTKFISTSNFAPTHSCASIYQRLSPNVTKYCALSKYRTFDGFCNNPYHPYWGKANVCHIRLLAPDYADGISAPRVSLNPHFPLPNPRALSSLIHFELPLEGLYNLMKMQWGQFINHDITNTALSSYDGLVDCCKNPNARGCWPIYLPPGDPFYGPHNVTCLNFIRSGVCPLCQLGPRQQSNKNTAFLDLSHIYGHSVEQANKLRSFRGGLLASSLSKNGEVIPPLATGQSQDQCAGVCFVAGDTRINQHPTLTALHTLLLRRHNLHAQGLARVHPDWNDEYLYQEARRLNIAEYQMITFGEYMPIVFGPLLSAYYKLYPQKYGFTQFNPKADPTTWNEYSTATCRFGHSQIASTFGIYKQLVAFRQPSLQPTYKLRDWYMQPSFIFEGLTTPLIIGLLSKSSEVVDPWITNDARDHLYKNHNDHTGGDLAATNIWRARDHAIPGYIHYLEYCFNYKVYSWKDLAIFIPPKQLYYLQKAYGIVENIDLFTGGLSERHFPGADIGPTFACVNGIQYYHLKFGDRYYFEHSGQPGSFNPVQLAEIRQSTLARLLCRTAYLEQVPYYAFLAASPVNPAVNCAQLGEIDYAKF